LQNQLFPQWSISPKHTLIPQGLWRAIE